MKTIKTVHIIGMGALGLLYGKNMIDNGAADVTYIMDEARFKKYSNQEFTSNGQKCNIKMASDTSINEPADLVIMAVKATGLDAAIKVMEPCVGPDTIIMSVMNGITSEETLGSHFGMDKMIYTVAQGMDAMKFGNELSYTKAGELHIGIIDSGKQENLDAVAKLLADAKLDHVLEEDILYRMWGKFMLNVGINQTCMVYNTTYSGAITVPEYFQTFVSAMREVIAIANAENIALSEKDLNMYVGIIKTLGPEGMPSMAQDRINGNYSEVESFAGTVIKIANKDGIYVPTNEFLYRKVKEIEAEY